MRWKNLPFVFGLLFIFSGANAQTSLEGLILDQVSNQTLDQIHIINLSNKKETVSNAKGEFKLMAQINDRLIFRCVGYQTDTVLLTSLNFHKHYMKADANMLKTVSIAKKVDIREQYAQTFNLANPYLLKPGRGFLFYPSAYFSKKGKQARKFVRFIKKEQYETKIDQRYNLKTVGEILPISGLALDAFMVLYRPSYAFVVKATPEEFTYYVMDCYSKYKLLPPEKKVLKPLKID